MNNIFRTLILMLSLTHCEPRTCCDIGAPGIPNVKVLDDKNQDLLNPENPNYFPHADLNMWTYRNEVFRILTIDIDTPYTKYNNNGKYYSLTSNDRESYNISHDETSRDFFLRLDEDMVDTITIVMDNLRLIHYELNHQIWEPVDGKGYVIVK